jgi:2-oxoglutarate ferredoxin oxidoreductase subunit beta
MTKEFKKPVSLKNTRHLYCAGCGHGIIHRLIAEIIDELGVRESTIGIAPVGCAVFGYDYFNFDVTEAPHGRPPAVATGIKRVLPDRIVFTYQGDGDLAAIGTGEIIHAANRSENITVIFVNNANYGMTGGQMAPTTMLDQKTLTTPFGRSVQHEGYALKICELLAAIDGTVFLARSAVNSIPNINTTKKLIRKAFQNQIDKKGFSLVEVLSPCPPNWGKTPLDACKYVDEVMTKTFPLGIVKDK